MLSLGTNIISQASQSDDDGIIAPPLPPPWPCPELIIALNNCGEAASHVSSNVDIDVIHFFNCLWASILISGEEAVYNSVLMRFFWAKC